MHEQNHRSELPTALRLKGQDLLRLVSHREKRRGNSGVEIGPKNSPASKIGITSEREPCGVKHQFIKGGKRKDHKERSRNTDEKAHGQQGGRNKKKKILLCT